jgi:UDP-2,3-diacylglucosamine hydrolase
MYKSKKTYFVSDIHLSESHPDITQQFLNFLTQCCDGTVDALYILGDLFEIWIGDDDDSSLNCQVIQALQFATQQGLKIFFLHGNRDFLIGKRFLNASGCKLLSTEEKIVLYGTPILLMHGDTLCTKDIAYLKWRKISHHPLFKIALILPLSVRRWFANMFRQKSGSYTRKTASELMDVTREAVEDVMQKHHVNYLIHGHTHKPNMHPLELNHKEAMRIVLGAWHDGCNLLIWDELGKKEWAQI